jgi:glyoxylase-like metal-dependent hydrolase (beta-lactamase superfamily II)
VIPFETSSKPWFGPTKRARVERLYSEAEEIVRKTGWYPLPQGSRLNSGLWKARFAGAGALAENSLPKIGSRLISIERSVPDDGGCGLRIRTDDGNVLLDAGLAGEIAVDSADRLALISHDHADHTGGLGELRAMGVHIAMSAETGGCLVATRRQSDAEIRERSILLSQNARFRSGGLMISSFPVPHSPGSVGYAVTDGTREVIYTGDICLRSHRHDFSRRLQEILAVQSHGLVERI